MMGSDQGKRMRDSRTCKWPIGDPSNSDFHFCGADRTSDRPYCAEHVGIAYQKSGKRETLIAKSAVPAGSRAMRKS